MGAPGKITRLPVYARLLGKVILYGLPRFLIHFGGGIGDDLLCSVVAHELRARNNDGIWVSSIYPELFVNNSDVDAVIHPNQGIAALSSMGVKIPWLAYSTNLPAEDRDTSPDEHILSIMCRAAGISGQIALRPYLHLSPKEHAEGLIVPGQISIQTSGLSAQYSMKNKEWFPERFQAIVDRFSSSHTFVQIGSAADPALSGVIDMRGKTSLRKTASILSRSVLFVGLVGGLMHLARSVDCRSVILYGGRELPFQSGYPCNRNLVGGCECSPCWRWNRCGHDRRCMSSISSEVAIEAVREMLNDPIGPLALTRVKI
ncbi:MAG: glycosyltransferase family 9 protein [Syntrophobacteraceae bacterium]